MHLQQMSVCARRQEQRPRSRCGCKTKRDLEHVNNHVGFSYRERYSSCTYKVVLPLRIL